MKHLKEFIGLTVTLLTVFVTFELLKNYEDAKHSRYREDTRVVDEYKDNCTKVGGKPAYNGNHWECLK